VKSLAGWVLLGAVAVAALGLYGREQRARGRAEAQLVALRAAYDSLGRVQRRVDTVHRVQRDTLYRRIARVDTMTLTVREWMHDTVEVIRYVTRTDSALRACLAADSTCTARLGVRDLRITNLEGQLAAMPRPRPAWKVWGERVALVAGTAAVCSAERR
jgi:hypothetical protein